MGGRFIERVWEADLARDTPAKYRKACKYQAYIPDQLGVLKPEVGLELAGLISDAEARIRALNEMARRALAPLSRLLLRTESIASSKVEGLAAGVREIARAEAKLDSGEGRTSGTAVDVIANIDAMETAIHEGADAHEFGVAEIRKIHERLMVKSSHPHQAGQLRTVQNWIGGNDYNPCGSDFVPPPPEEVAALLDDLCAAINDDILPPVVQAALVHAQFETIHPFEDGNGRTGRALIHVLLKRRGVATHYVPPISVVFARSRDRYISGLNQFRDDNVSGWLEHFAAAAARAANLAERYLHDVGELQTAWRATLEQRYAPLRRDAAAWAIIGILPAYPYLVAPIAAAATGRSKPQIYQALDELVSAGVLQLAGRAGRTQVFEAVGLLDLLIGLERTGN
jgi:Fic family protein